MQRRDAKYSVRTRKKKTVSAYFYKSPIVSGASLEIFRMFSGVHVINSHVTILTGCQYVLLSSIDFHVIKGGLSCGIVTSRKLWCTVWRLKTILLNDFIGVLLSLSTYTTERSEN